MIDLTSTLATSGVVFSGLGKVVCHPKSKVTIGAGSRISCPITVLGENNVVSIGSECILHGGITLKCKNSILGIGNNVTWGHVNLMMHESNNILIGDDCMFSTNIFLDVSDMHPIFDIQSGARINASEPIVLGSHVWIGYGATLLRGAQVAEGCIVGAGSVLKGRFPVSNCAIAGNPARIVKFGVRWERNLNPETGYFPG